MTIQNPPPTLESDNSKKHFSKVSTVTALVSRRGLSVVSSTKELDYTTARLCARRGARETRMCTRRGAGEAGEGGLLAPSLRASAAAGVGGARAVA